MHTFDSQHVRSEHVQPISWPFDLVTGLQKNQNCGMWYFHTWNILQQPCLSLAKMMWKVVLSLKKKKKHTQKQQPQASMWTFVRRVRATLAWDQAFHKGTDVGILSHNFSNEYKSFNIASLKQLVNCQTWLCGRQLWVWVGGGTWWQRLRSLLVYRSQYSTVSYGKWTTQKTSFFSRKISMIKMFHLGCLTQDFTFPLSEVTT